MILLFITNQYFILQNHEVMSYIINIIVNISVIIYIISVVLFRQSNSNLVQLLIRIRKSKFGYNNRHGMKIE